MYKDFAVELNMKARERVKTLNDKILQMEFNSKEQRYISMAKSNLALNEYLLELSEYYLPKEKGLTCH